MSHKMTLSIVSVAALSMFVVTNDVHAEGRVRAYVSQKAKKFGKWVKSFNSVSFAKKGAKQRQKGLHEGQQSDKKLITGLMTDTANLWKAKAAGNTALVETHSGARKTHLKGAFKKQRASAQNRVVGGAKFVGGYAAVPLEVVGRGGMATLGALAYGLEYTGKQTLAATASISKKTTKLYRGAQAQLADTQRTGQNMLANVLGGAAESLKKGSSAVSKETGLQKTVKARTSHRGLRRGALQTFVANKGKGMSDAKLATYFEVSRSTITADRKALNIPTAKQRMAEK
ncbi:MAG: hypothetical protein JRH20_09440 [Deltaproteobacteria bacterium]|nr:hypothetical protein [Deltaproteobacteria bacterium]